MRLFKYKEIFRVTIKHDYYKKKYSKDFSFEPSEYCRKLLNNHNLKFKPTPYGFAVFAEVEESGSDEKLIRSFLDDTKFTFLVKLTNPFFLNFTDIPVKKKPHTIYYFNNLTNHEAGGELMLINKSEIPKTSSNASQTIMSSGIYKYTHNSADSSKTGTVTFIDEGFNINQDLENNNDEFQFRFDLSQFNTGRCSFSVDSVNETFYAANEIYNEGVFGIIEIFTKSSVPGNYQFVGSGDIVTTKEYIVPFANRSTMWRYLVYDKLTNSLNSPQIDMAGTDFDMVSTPASSYPDDYTLFKFTSGEEGASATEKALPLTEDPVLNIKLSGIRNGLNKDIIENLPNPDITLIKPDTTDNSKIYSDINIYV